jgi:hypothetical protein
MLIDLLTKLVSVTYLAGMMHGEGLLGTESHQKMFDEGKELLTQIKVLLTQRALDAAESGKNTALPYKKGIY